MSYWEIKKTDTELVDELSAKTGYSKTLVSVLFNRGINTHQQIEKFIHPQFADLHNPFLFTDMQKAVDRIRKAIAEGEKILIYGDSDVDGISSTSIAYLCLKDLGARVCWYVPSDEGYGLHGEIISAYKKEGVRLIITVDCGITAVEEINLSNSLGIDVIITDHHESSTELPKAVAIINPKCPNEKYPFRELAGCAVAFKLFQAVESSYSDNFDIQKYIHLVALGTVADMVPLVSENRVFVKHGIPLFFDSQKPGISAIIDNLQIEKKLLTAKKLSWLVIPLLNSAGRYGKASVSAQLLNTDDKIHADVLFEEILAINDERRDLQKINIKSFLEETICQNDIKNDKVLITVVSNLEHGVTGIAANQIARQFNRPVILLILEGEEAVGSARSICGFDIRALIEKCSDIVIKYGGHKTASGVTVAKKNLDEFVKRIKFLANNLITEEMLVYHLPVDVAISASDVSLNLVNELDFLEPYGFGNEHPTFVINDAVLSSLSSVGVDGAHLRMTIENGKANIGGIGWQLGRRAVDLRKGQKVNVAFHIERNIWQNRESAQLMVLDIESSDR